MLVTYSYPGHLRGKTFLMGTEVLCWWFGAVATSRCSNRREMGAGGHRARRET